MRKQNQQSKRYVDAHTQIELLCLELSSSILLTLVVGRMLDPFGLARRIFHGFVSPTRRIYPTFCAG